MNTPTPTGNAVDTNTPPLDVSILARMANELFAALPGNPGTGTGPHHMAATPPNTDVTPAEQPTAPQPRPTAPDWPITVAPGVIKPHPNGLGLPGTRPPGGLPPTTPSGLAHGLPPQFYFLEHHSPVTAPPSAAPPAGLLPFDVHAVRRDFPILAERLHGRPLVWLDNAATTQKPRAVTDQLTHFYTHENSNIHRAAHDLAARATDAYENARDTVARFLGAPSSDNVVFVRGATEAINLVAQTWGRQHIRPGDEIVLSHLEHHANIVPWQFLTEEKGAVLRVIPVDDSGQIVLDEYRRLLNDRTRLVAVTHVSNALGTLVPIREVIEAAHQAGALTLIDGAQAVAHLRVNMQSLDPDFYVFSGHKVFAPTGIGVLYGKSDVLDSMSPWHGGGNMIEDVTFERSTFQQPPNRFEAGTGNIADAVGLGAALDYLERLGLENIANYEHNLLEYATHGLQAIPGLHLIGTASQKASVLSFVLDGYRPDEVGSALNREGIAVRTGHHCAQPILRRFGLEATVRPSLAMYNTHGEVDQLVAALHGLASNNLRR
jgi:cysteine desulfurase / selenocysteine lyase